MKNLFEEKLLKELKRKGIVAVIEIEKEEDAIPVVEALLEGGVSAIELALRTPAAMSSIRKISQIFPQMLIGAGTVIQKGQAKAVKEIGASFGLAPGSNPDIINEAIACGFSFIPGISTASELEIALSKGYRLFKLFPAVPLGGVEYFTSMTAPYSYLNLEFFPLGGVNLQNLEDWISQKNVSVIGGSWIASKKLIRAKDYNQIRTFAEEAISVWNKNRG